MSRILSDLHPKALPQFHEFLARCTEANIPIMIVETGRTQQRQDELWAIGRTDGKPASSQVTWTLDSKHIMKPSQGMKSLAIDICPYEEFEAHGPDKLDWNDKDPDWDKIGAIGQAVGLKWGVVETNGIRKDKGHFEFAGSLT